MIGVLVFNEILKQLVELGKNNDGSISSKEILKYYKIDSEEYDNIIKQLNNLLIFM